MAEWKFPVFGHGGDYNPDQWLYDPNVFEEDLRLMKLSHCNIMSVGIFAWAALEPEEGVYTFDWLANVIDRLYENGVSVLLATPSGARPAWMSQKYPEVLRVNEMGMRNLHGGRHNHCFTSPIYREKVHAINEQLALRFGKHPGVVGWHISNELSGNCHCDYCQEAFREFLKAEYGTLDKLNHCWWTSFWAHTYTDWSQIEPPSPIGEHSLHALNLEWMRFTTQQTVDFFKNEIEPLRRLTPDIPITTNFMTRFSGLDYFKFKDVIDVCSWDSYPRWGYNPESDEPLATEIALYHDCMRSILDKPWILMESAPSLTNWQEYAKLKRPGMHLLSCMQAVAHGADSIQYFQWRKSRGSSEKFHGAVVGHSGHENTRVFRDVTQVGQYLADIAPALHSVTHAKAAMIYDWENHWAIEDAQGMSKDKQYEETMTQHYSALKRQGIDVDVIDMEQCFDKYDMIVAPTLYMVKPGVAERLEKFVERGGQLVLTYLSGIADRDDLCFLGGMPGPLRKLAGVWVEELDTLLPGDKNSVVACTDNEAGISGTYECGFLCDLMHAETAKVEAVYGEDFYKDMPALTCNDFGKGRTWYIATRPEARLLEQLYSRLVDAAGIERLLPEVPQGISCASRDGADDTKYLWIMNFAREPIVVHVPAGYIDMITGTPVSGNTEIGGIKGITLARRR